MSEIVFQDVTKVYPGERVALDHLTITIARGEFFSLVGPSGCGKTTALRILAGLEEPTGGRVHIGGRDVTDIEIHQRNLGIITQENLLLQHRSAGGNIGFPIEGLRRRTRIDARARVEFEAAGLGIGHLLDRKPATLSEGERRLVQLARAIISSPSVLLMDEPLAFLEAQMRARLHTAIRQIHDERGMTIVLVTASQHDAMALSDRIGVLIDGVLHQIGSPHDVYSRPATAAVARFFGEPSMNVLAADVLGSSPAEGTQLEILGQVVTMWTPLLADYVGRSVLVGVRPEDVVIGAEASRGIEAHVHATEPLGSATLTEVSTLDGPTLSCRLPGSAPPIGTVLDIGLRPERLHLFDPATELAFLHPPARR